MRLSQRFVKAYINIFAKGMHIYNQATKMSASRSALNTKVHKCINAFIDTFVTKKYFYLNSISTNTFTHQYLMYY